ncbi:hypothetical protein L873DRAFT_511123 [Choiromyces venosus 120613-1]|uniref:C2H2-type domain-containing protein n=1 Tax=Choiromyces venosus 120613-1 TaxID=1336337 RepID=A0A3N4IUZ2_9PEZI|nr:hypothetical protein L873DRAFT_511123 [Choiromyces venosus 120613-1]
MDSLFAFFFFLTILLCRKATPVLHTTPLQPRSHRHRFFQGTLDLVLLNPELGPLPLHLHDDGWCLVLSPPLSHTNPRVNQKNHSTNNIPTVNNVNILAPTITPRGKVYCGSSRCTGNKLIISSPLLAKVYPARRLTQRSGPHICSRRSFTCNTPDCARATLFQTKQALNRHYEIIHLDERLDCPVPGCQNVGERGIKRYDNLVAHVRSKHGITLANGSQGD